MTGAALGEAKLRVRTGLDSLVKCYRGRACRVTLKTAYVPRYGFPAVLKISLAHLAANL